MKKDEKQVYWVWADMVGRCNNPSHQAYKNYGGRGIDVSQDWLDSKNFMRDMYPRPLESTLDRKDNSLGYSKENCAWVSRLENNLNKRVYKNSPFGLSGIIERNGKFRVRIRRNSKIIFSKTVVDFFEACCLAKSISKDKIK